MRSSFANRLNRIAARIPGDPTAIFADRPLGDEDAESLLRNWRSEVSATRARRSASALYVVENRGISAEEWEAKYCREPDQ